MVDYAILFIGTVLVNNFVLVQRPSLGGSNPFKSAIAVGTATTIVMTLASICSELLYTYLLAPFALHYLKTISFILVIATIAQFAKMYVEKARPLLAKELSVYLPLVTINCAMLAVALQNSQIHTLLQTSLYGFGTALGFSLVLVLFAAMHERIAVADVPEPFKGASISLITAGLISLAFMGVAGLV
jgi:electron transport complex protein RnfA